MSRSYKKSPYANDSHRKSTKESKKFANKKVRNITNIPNGGAYKKIFESWDIRDYSFRQTWEEAKEYYEKNKDSYWMQKRYPTLKDWYRRWLKYYKNK